MSALEEEPVELPLSPDELAEQKVDNIHQNRFDAFAPPEELEGRVSSARKLAAQSVVRVAHVLDAVVMGPSVYVSQSEKNLRNKERQAVGLKPKR